MFNINQKLNFNNLLLLFFILFPCLMITGPFLPDLFSSLLSIFFLFLLFRGKINFKFNKKIFLFFILFFLILILSTLINGSNLKSMKTSFLYFRHFTFLIMLIYILNIYPKLYKLLFYGLTIIFIILIIDGYTEYFFSTGILSNSIKENSRISSFFGDEYILGSYISKLFLIYFFLYKKQNFKNKIFIISIFSILIFAYFLVFMTGERSSFFLLNLSMIIMLIFYFNLKNLIIFSLFISITLFSLSKDTNLKHRYIDLTKNTFKFVYEKNYYDELSFNLKTSSEIIKKNFIFGSGPRNYYLECSNYWKNEDSQFIKSCRSHPHNYHLQLLAEVGLFGYLFILIFLIYLIWKLIIMKLHKNLALKNDKNITILIIALIMVLWPFTTTGNFFNNWLSYINYFLLALFFNESRFLTKFQYQK